METQVSPAFTVDDRVRYRQQLATVQHVSAGGDVALIRLDDGELVATATVNLERVEGEE